MVPGYQTHQSYGIPPGGNGQMGAIHGAGRQSNVKDTLANSVRSRQGIGGYYRLLIASSHLPLKF